LAAESSCSTVDGSCEKYLSALTAWQAACYPFEDSMLLPTIDLFADLTAGGLFVQRCEALSGASGISDFGAQLDVCTARLRSATSCGDGEIALRCLIRGTLDDGSACASDAQCAGGHCVNPDANVPTSETLCGICETDVAVGGSCKSRFCESTTGSCVGNVCVAFVPRGAACDSGQACDIGLQCDSTTKTCQPFPSLGAPCIRFCQMPYACVAGTCSPPVAAGGPCTDWTECQPNLQCDPQSSTCVAVPTSASSTKPAGAACIVGNFECAAGLSCTGNTCQMPVASTCHF
jgi:hypothetical protein